MRNRRCKLNVSHALPAHARLCDLHAAAVTDHTFITDFLVLAAMTLPVLAGSENLFAVQTIALRLQRPVVDRLRLCYLAF